MTDATSPEKVREGANVLPIRKFVTVAAAPLSRMILFSVLIVVLVAVNCVTVLVPNCSTNVSLPGALGAKPFVQRALSSHRPLPNPQAYSVLATGLPE
ncbi:MAG: hypothetical protein PCFJNLEI_04225 [Verrucomicrobiae bacterium]|nr:hypothetical protein [Verrucomicrobiae bacterium]